MEVLSEGKETSQKKVGPVQLHDKGEWLYLPDQRAEYYPKPEHIQQTKLQMQSTMPRYDGPLTRYQLS